MYFQRLFSQCVFFLLCDFAFSATDPAAPRDFCGRIVIIYNGAGERKVYEPKTEAINTNAAIKAFIWDSKVLVPSLVFTSDPAVRDSERLTALEKTGSTRVMPASIPSFTGALSNRGYLAEVRAQFDNCEPCKALVKPGEDVSKYLKIEIFVFSHSARNGTDEKNANKYKGLPSWNSDEEQGSDLDYISTGSPVLTQKDFQPLYDLFPNALIQSFAATCDSVNVGETIAPADDTLPTAGASCYCYAGLVARDLIAPVRGDIKTDTPIDDSGSIIGAHLVSHSSNGKWLGANSLEELNLSVLNYFRTNARVQDYQSLADSIFETNPKSLNPFDNYAITSLDALIARQTKNKVPSAPDLRVATARTKPKTDPEVQRLLSEIGANFVEPNTKANELTPIATKFLDSQVRSQQSFFNQREKLRDYLNNCIIDLTQGGCATLNQLIQGSQNRGDKKLANVFRSLGEGIGTFKDRDKFLFGSCANYAPLTNQEQGQFLIALEEVKKNWLTFQEFKIEINSAAYDHNVIPQAIAELASFSKKMAAFHQSFLHAYFPDLIADTLSRRSAAVKAYVNEIVSSNAATTGVEVERLKEVRDQINCLTNFPMGPAFDQKYLVSKLPKTQPMVATSIESTGPNKQGHQVFLLAPGKGAAGATR